MRASRAISRLLKRSAANETALADILKQLKRIESTSKKTLKLLEAREAAAAKSEKPAADAKSKLPSRSKNEEKKAEGGAA